MVWSGAKKKVKVKRKELQKKQRRIMTLVHYLLEVGSTKQEVGLNPPGCLVEAGSITQEVGSSPPSFLGS